MRGSQSDACADGGKEQRLGAQLAKETAAAGSKRMVSIDLHSGQIQGFFYGPVDHLTAMPVLEKYVRKNAGDGMVIVSPDAGRVKVAERFAQHLSDKNADVAGTWFEAAYPGCRVDNPNHNYSYSFAQRHDWPFHFSTQAFWTSIWRSWMTWGVMVRAFSLFDSASPRALAIARRIRRRRKAFGKRRTEAQRNSMPPARRWRDSSAARLTMSAQTRSSS